MNKRSFKANENETEKIFADLQYFISLHQNYYDIFYSNSDNNKMDKPRSIYILHALI